MQKKGQGAFEYILMLAGILLIVVLIILILQGTIAGAAGGVTQGQNVYNQTANAANVVSDKTVNIVVKSNAGSTIGAAPIPCIEGTAAVGSACTTNISCTSKFFNNATGICI